MAIEHVQHRDETLQQLFRALPSVNDLLLTPGFQALLDAHPRRQVVPALRRALAELRTEISSEVHTPDTLQLGVQRLPERAAIFVRGAARYSLRPVINATGVLLHTNLGRAPLSEAALDHVVEVARGYSNLELDLETGGRSKRDAHAEAQVLRVLSSTVCTVDAGEYGVVIVNNCAAATMLALNSLAEKAEVIVSRGELVEIGGGFRIPEIMEKSGAVLKEVGTTNRTRIADYERAIGEATGLLLRVHQSNFAIEGFAESATLAELVALARRTGVTLFEDQGTGLVSSLERFGVRGEPSLVQSFVQGVDLMSASGDKLLGGPQCGILVGRKKLIERIRKNPLLRAFRVDKLTYAALEATLVDHLSGELSSIPVVRMLGIAAEEIMRRCRAVADQADSSNLVVDVVPVASLIGGGTAPKASLQSCAVSLKHISLDAAELLAALRRGDPPIIGRIEDDAVLLDLRTVPPDFDVELAARLGGL